jgi:hypothetical protein
MKSTATTVEQYFSELPDDRKEPMLKLHNVIKKNLSKGFIERIDYGMICFSVPHIIYPNGYHCDPKMPLPFISIASQKNFIALYHMGIYSSPELFEWFTKSYAAKVPGKLDMGKSCIRFKKVELIPYELIGELAAKMSGEEWISCYEKLLKRNK